MRTDWDYALATRILKEKRLELRPAIRLTVPVLAAMGERRYRLAQPKREPTEFQVTMRDIFLWSYVERGARDPESDVQVQRQFTVGFQWTVTSEPDNRAQISLVVYADRKAGLLQGPGRDYPATCKGWFLMLTGMRI
ncbi:hypothetical protein [Allonocardiopsis opalescens]|uniref:Uncharacterized protein n=1 Tax=Allonocardiopsis opalescens TaxID=1144618 RepID=A0A2T0Q0D3_9ACTN|nr:hypothetical protein [Allonocardiopsis opalescens]PRX97244.1 hypothetical protein CLV72_106280 [Allonocardiopsis opalescens]